MFMCMCVRVCVCVCVCVRALTPAPRPDLPVLVSTDVLDEQKLSESAALATARVTSSDDEDLDGSSIITTTTTIKTTSTTGSSIADITCPPRSGKHLTSIRQVQAGCVQSGNHGNPESVDTECGTAGERVPDREGLVPVSEESCVVDQDVVEARENTQSADGCTRRQEDGQTGESRLVEVCAAEDKAGGKRCGSGMSCVRSCFCVL